MFPQKDKQKLVSSVSGHGWRSGVSCPGLALGRSSLKRTGLNEPELAFKTREKFVQLTKLHHELCGLGLICILLSHEISVS